MGFYDAKGYWRSEGEAFYDSKGNLVSPGCGFYDGRGYLRGAGDGFFDSKGRWVNPGEGFYDGKGYFRTPDNPRDAEVQAEQGIAAGIGFLFAVSVVVLWLLTVSVVEWIAGHLYLVFGGYVIAEAILCFAVTGAKKQRGIKAVFSFSGNFICLLTFIYIILVYAVPYIIINDGGFGSFLEFTMVSIMGIAGIAVVQFFNYYHENAILEFILGILFFMVIIKLLRYGIEDIVTIESLAEIYHAERSALFRRIFGFVF